MIQACKLPVGQRVHELNTDMPAMLSSQQRRSADDKCHLKIIEAAAQRERERKEAPCEGPRKSCNTVTKELPNFLLMPLWTASLSKRDMLHHCTLDILRLR